MDTNFYCVLQYIQITFKTQRTIIAIIEFFTAANHYYYDDNQQTQKKDRNKMDKNLHNLLITTRGHDL